MTAVATPDAARLVFAAVAGLILLLVLIIKFKVHAMISILIGAVGIGLMAGMPLSDIIGSVTKRPRGHWASRVWWWPCRCSLTPV